jgi:hypothetical protein
MIHLPTSRGLTVCEQIIVEERTRNVTLVNCFTRLFMDQFPSEARPFAIYSSLIDGFGEITLDLLTYRLDDYEEISKLSQRVQFPDRLQEVKYLFRLNHFAFPVEGQYQVSLLADGELIAQNRIDVILRRP